MQQAAPMKRLRTLWDRSPFWFTWASWKYTRPMPLREFLRELPRRYWRYARSDWSL